MVHQSICLCTEAGVLTPESLARLTAQVQISQNNNPLLPGVQTLLATIVPLFTRQVCLISWQAIDLTVLIVHCVRRHRSLLLPLPATILPTLSPCARVLARLVATLDVTVVSPDAMVHASPAPRSALPTRPGSEIRLRPGSALRTGWPALSTAGGRPLGSASRFRPTSNRVVDALLSVRVPTAPLFRESTMFR